VGTVASMFIVAGLTYRATAVRGMGQPFLYCFDFRALISPTDPVAVLAT